MSTETGATEGGLGGGGLGGGGTTETSAIESPTPGGASAPAGTTETIPQEAPSLQAPSAAGTIDTATSGATALAAPGTSAVADVGPLAVDPMVGAPADPFAIAEFSGSPNPSGTAQTGFVREVINRALVEGGQPSQEDINKALNLDINRSLGYEPGAIQGPFATFRQVLAGFLAVFQGPLSLVQLGVKGLLGGFGTVTSAGINPREVSRESGGTETGSTFDTSAGLNGAFASLPLIAGGSGGATSTQSVPQSTDPFVTGQTPATSGAKGGGGGGGGGGETPSGAAVTYVRPSVLIPLLLILIGLAVAGYYYYKSKRRA